MCAATQQLLCLEIIRALLESNQHPKTAGCVFGVIRTSPKEIKLHTVQHPANFGTSHCCILWPGPSSTPTACFRHRPTHDRKRIASVPWESMCMQLLAVPVAAGLWFQQWRHRTHHVVHETPCVREQRRLASGGGDLSIPLAKGKTQGSICLQGAIEGQSPSLYRVREGLHTPVSSLAPVVPETWG